MTFELQTLILATLLQLATYVAYSVAGNLQVGKKIALGRRDEHVQLTGTAGRIQRTMNNNFEGLILFAIAALTIAVTGQSSPLTISCAAIFLAARTLYIPAYIFGLVPWRSLIWSAGWLATSIMLIATLL